jgi:hypothetical protein
MGPSSRSTERGKCSVTRIMLADWLMWSASHTTEARWRSIMISRWRPSAVVIISGSTKGLPSWSPPTQEPNSRTRPNRGVSSGNWRASSSSNSLNASRVAEIKGFSKNSSVLSISWFTSGRRTLSSSIYHRTVIYSARSSSSRLCSFHVRSGDSIASSISAILTCLRLTLRRMASVGWAVITRLTAKTVKHAPQRFLP